MKLYFPLRPVQGLEERDAQTYWYSNHGPIIRRQAAGVGIQRYVQVHRVADELEDGLRKARGTEVDGYMGHAELWFDRTVLGISTPEQAARVAAAADGVVVGSALVEALGTGGVDAAASFLGAIRSGMDRA